MKFRCIAYRRKSDRPMSKYGLCWTCSPRGQG